MSPGDLAQVLRSLPKYSHPKLVVGSETFDDAGVYLLTPDVALIQTLDFFPPIVDDPLWFGRIAAANSLSDVYAMGGTPITAMNIVGFPDKLSKEILAEILRGGLEKVIESGAAMAGGHTVTDVDIKFGLSVTGTTHPSVIWSNDKLQAGDAIILTKPLGMGCFSTAVKKEQVPDDIYEAGCAIMATLNANACEIGRRHGVQCATDITGFGLVGHLGNMARASNKSIRVRLADLAFFPPSLDYAKKGLFSGGVKRGMAGYAGQYDIAAGADELRSKLIFDAETSGGLALAIPAGKADALLRNLHAAGLKDSRIIAEVLPRGAVSISII